MCQYKAPHRNWLPGPKYLDKYKGVKFPEPKSLFDDYKGRTSSASEHKMGLDKHFREIEDLKVTNAKGKIDRGVKRMTPQQRVGLDKVYGKRIEE